jgi:hypothetical protein
MTAQVIIPFVRRGPGANNAIEMSIWCRQQGLIIGTDYSWSFNPEDNEIVFKFYGASESLATMFALVWVK